MPVARCTTPSRRQSARPGSLHNNLLRSKAFERGIAAGYAISDDGRTARDSEGLMQFARLGGVGSPSFTLIFHALRTGTSPVRVKIEGGRPGKRVRDGS